MDLKVHTVLVTVGPTNSGKSYWANKMRQYIANEFPEIKLRVIASDSIRRRLLGDYTIHKYDPRMMQVSKYAFELLSSELRAATSYPINTELIIVDSTGLSSKFRQEMIEIARENNYNVDAVIFDMDKEGYNEFLNEEDQDNPIMWRHIKKFKNRAVKNMRVGGGKDFDQKHVIKSKNFDEYMPEIVDYHTYVRNHIEGDATVFGDLHGSYDELLLAAHEAGFSLVRSSFGPYLQHPDKTAVFLGDIIDKGPEEGVKNLIDLVFLTVYHGAGKFIVGNHENFVVKYLRGQIKGVDQDLIDNWFDSIHYLDDERVERLFWLYDHGHEFVQHQSFIATHAPCKKKYLGKLDRKSVKKQQTFYYPKRNDYNSDVEWEEAIFDAFKFIEEEDEYNFPIHIWGHVAMERWLRTKSNLGIDTGVASGNKLTYVDIIDGYYNVSSVPSKSDLQEQLLNSVIDDRKQIDLDSLEGKQRARLDWVVKNKVNFISGTMCPSDAQDGVLEPIHWALKYYKDNGIDEVILQPKYMGSRAQVYIFEDPSKCYFVSRSGFRQDDRFDLTEEYERLIELFKEDFQNGLYLRIIDAEILPWRLLGAGLVDRQFYGLLDVATAEQEFLKSVEFDSQFDKWRDKFSGKFEEKSKEQVVKSEGYHIWSMFRAYEEFDYMTTEERLEFLKVFEKQLELYGQDRPVEVKPFSILKDVWAEESGKDPTQPFYTEKLYDNASNVEMAEMLIDDPYLVISTDNNRDAGIFLFNLTANKGFEGVVVKPVNVSVENIAPYIKVRNEEYLTLVYGYDYLSSWHYDKLIKRKRINRKLRQSIEDWKRGWKMLSYPYNNLDQESYRQLVAEHVFDEVKGIDPRL